MVGSREWQGRTQDLELGGGASGVSRISARGVLKVRPYEKWGGGASGPIYEKWGGGGGGGASGPIYEKWRGGHSAASGPIPLGTQKISTCTYLGILHTREHAGKG